jgi:hypothetical protein
MGAKLKGYGCLRAWRIQALHGETRGSCHVMDRVSVAIWSFYREDPELARRLDPLLAARLGRGWGCVRIECRDAAHRGVVSGLLPLLRPPLEALALAREIRLLAPGCEPLVFPVVLPIGVGLLAYDGSIGE